MPWGTVTAGTAITSTLLRPYFRAREERYRAAHDVAAPDITIEPAAGDTFASLRAVDASPLNDGDASIARLQNHLEPGWWVATKKLSGGVYVDLTSYDGEPDIRQWSNTDSDSTTKLFEAVLGHMWGFKRGIKRTIMSSSATEYVNADCGSVENGHKARCVGSGSEGGRVFERVAGAWVDAGDDARADTVYAYGSDPMVGGTMGDVYGTWLLNETRTVLQHLKWLAAGAGGWSAFGGDSYHFGVGSADTWAGAKAAAEADWDGRSDEVANSAPEASSFGTFDGSETYNASIVRYREKVQLGFQTQFGKDVEFYIGPATATNGDTFDANGDTVSTSTLKLFESQAAVAAGTANLTSGWFGTLAIKPVWCADPTADGDHATARGYVGGGGRGVQKVSGFTDT